ncbi:hypothetical protein GGR50DRAFT_696677 [Xylaria sp. CBS 124048]|nr:hypothetical protein GGR50DRAFT_696677 [Xylaria sp. CBS 124048]
MEHVVAFENATLESAPMEIEAAFDYHASEIQPNTLTMLTSSGFFLSGQDEVNNAEKIRYVQAGIEGQPYVYVTFGTEFLDCRDPNYFPLTFIKIFPYGLGGPVSTRANSFSEKDFENEKNF